MNESNELQPAETKAMDRPINKTQFKNHGAIKAAGRGIILEALTAFKGGKVGKKGLLFRAMAELERAFDAKEDGLAPLDSAAIRARKDWAVEQSLKLALAITKDDKAEAGSLAELLKGGSNVQINFNNYFSQRSGVDRQDLPTVSFGPASQA